MKKIAFLDSGLGGLTVLREAIKFLPNEDYIYYADSANAPYGVKSKGEVKQLVFNAVKFIISLDIKALVIACNTATSVAIEDLRQMYDFPIIGMEPAIKPAIEKYNGTSKRVLVLATDLSLKESKLTSLISKMKADNMVDLLSLPKIVEMVESFECNEGKIIEYITNALLPYNISEYGAIVLGCTHYITYNYLFRKVLPLEVTIVDGNAATIKHLKHVLEEKLLLNSQGNGQFAIYYGNKKIC